MNIVRLKWQMRKYARSHKPPIREVPRMKMVPVWGHAAQALSWRICGHTDRRAAWSFFNPPSLAEEVILVAANQVGVTEHPFGSNSGKQVNEYQSATGAYGAPWCGSFVTWCYLRAARRIGKSRPRLAPVPGYVPSWTDMIRAGRNGWRRVEPWAALPGDVVTFWGSEHMGLIEKREGSIFHTIEGNTSGTDRSNGGMVARMERSASDITVVGRYR